MAPAHRHVDRVKVQAFLVDQCVVARLGLSHESESDDHERANLAV